MINILRNPDDVIIQVNGGKVTDATVRFELADRKLNVYLTAKTDEPQFVCLRWNCITDRPVKVLGDAWERSYADLSWQGMSAERFLPWYFLVDNGSSVTGCGVMVRPNSFVSFEYDTKGVTAWFDVRCGAKGVQLNGRELCIGTIVCEEYINMPAFKAAQEFCKVMCTDPVLPEKPIYGSNNWYYAYGVSSGEEIRQDAALLAELCKGNENPPFMVIDDGWQVNSCAGPWVGNEKHGDMGEIVKDFNKMGVRAGIWIRPLRDLEVQKEHPDWCMTRDTDGEYLLDPSHPEVKNYIRETVNRIADWGFELLKHDYTTFDMFVNWGVNLNGMICNKGEWSFYDRTKTSAEILLDLYRLIREAGKGMMILGCNTVSHMCAGLAEMYRTGDDTSGRVWSRTRAIGVNTLAFRMPQNRAFYMVDADCVGILEDNIPWELNKQWLDLVAKSGSPLFISAQPSALTEEMKEDIRKAYKINSVQADTAIPLDWQYNNVPDKWDINGETVEYDWIKNSYPPLMFNRVLPYFKD